MEGNLIENKCSYHILKRLTDVFASFFGLFFLSPFFIIIGISIKVNSRGPVFFRGIRTGLLGKPFRIYKFRSMYVGSEKKAGTTSKNDHRITIVGKITRKYKLDELPQLINVLVGDMSIVGPRPELPKYTSKYIGEELMILQVKPGITDLSSIKFSNLNELIEDTDPDLSFEENFLKEKNQLRIQYVKSSNYLLDIRLIFLTLYKIFLKK